MRRENSRGAISFQRQELTEDGAPRPGRFLAAGILALLAFCGGTAAGVGDPSSDSLRVIPVGRYDFEALVAPDPALLPEGLSGLAWEGGDRYFAVGDEHACLHRLTIQVNSKTGEIVKARFGNPVRLCDSLGVPIPDTATGKDREGVAIDSSNQSVWAANEWTGSNVHSPSIEEHSLTDGRLLTLLTPDSDRMLKVFEKIRYNLGFESMTRRPDGSEFWTANEGPLTVDGPRATDSTGAVVRLQKFDAAMRPVAQYAYRIDRYPKRISAPFFLGGNEVSGLSELAALPDGRLLALERAFSGDSTGAANFRDRIYLVDTAGATDIGQGELASGLLGKSYTPIRKTLLWELNSGFTNSNFEGMALGEKLENGDQLLLLIADNNEGRSQALYSLRLAGSGRP